jgi:hypothetical protein
MLIPARHDHLIGMMSDRFDRLEAAAAEAELKSANLRNYPAPPVSPWWENGCRLPHVRKTPPSPHTGSP